jgi:uncharacterized protein DUF6174
LVAACHAAPPPAPPLEPERTVTLRQRERSGALTPAERDSLVRELEVHRDAWRARHIDDYRIQIAAGCFCPWPSNPAILEVRGGVAVALRDTTGKSMGAPREPWSAYTVEGLFDVVAQTARRSDVVQVAYDPQYGYPALIRGDSKVGLPDDWFWVKASRLTPAR